MDAAGKDGVIRTVFSTLSPHGVKEYCFKVPSNEEKSHDFLWRFWSALPPRGFVSIFNRSYYEDDYYYYDDYYYSRTRAADSTLTAPADSTMLPTPDSIVVVNNGKSIVSGAFAGNAK